MYFVTSATVERKYFFRHERWCKLFVDVLYHYRRDYYQLHEFVLMPDHFHILMTPQESLEKAIQVVKGGFSRQASLQFETKQTVWQRGFTDHRIRDVADYERHKSYIWLNPVKAGLCQLAAQYAYSSASSQYALDPIPQGLKPLVLDKASGTAEAVPFPNPVKAEASGVQVWSIQAHHNKSANMAEAVPPQVFINRKVVENLVQDGKAEAPPLQGQRPESGGTVETVPFLKIKEIKRETFDATQE